MVAGVVAVLAGSTPAQAATATTCSMGTDGANHETICWIDFSGFDDAAALGAGQDISVQLPNGVGTLTFRLTAAHSVDNQVEAVAAPSVTGANFGAGIYDGVAGKPVLEQHETDPSKAAYNVITMTGIAVKDGDGDPVRGYAIVGADGNTVTNAGSNTQYLAFNADTPIYQLVQPGNPPVCGTDLNGLGTTQVECWGSTATQDHAVTLWAKAPTSFGANMQGSAGVKPDGALGAAFGIEMATVQTKVVVNGRARAADSFTARASSPSGLLANASTGADPGSSALTPPVTVWPDGSTSYSLALGQDAGSDLAAYDVDWSCTDDGDAYTSGTVAADKSHVTVTPQPGNALLCTATLDYTDVFADGNDQQTTPDTAVTSPLSALVTNSGPAVLDPASVTATQPSHGTTTVDLATGAVTYTPAAGYEGSDSYVLHVCDDAVPAQCHDRTVTVTVAAKVVVAPPTSPAIGTRASAARRTVKVNRAGKTRGVRLSGRVTIAGFRTGGSATGSVALVGPVSHRSAAACVSGPVVKRFSFTPRNGSFSTASVKVTRPGVYTWVASTSADRLNRAVKAGCGVRASQTLVHRAKYGKVRIETGFDGVAPGGRFFARLFATGRVSVKAIGMHALLNTVPLRKGSMMIPGDVRRGGWLSRSAAPGESVGSAVIAGHVSSYHDRPGAFGKLRRAKVGQVVRVTGVGGKSTRYRITKIRKAARSRGFKGWLTSTTSSPKLVLVTCTDEVHYPNGHFHYRKNLIVVAVPIG